MIASGSVISIARTFDALLAPTNLSLPSTAEVLITSTIHDFKFHYYQTVLVFVYKPQYRITVDYFENGKPTEKKKIKITYSFFSSQG